MFPFVNNQTGELEKPVIEARTTYWRDIAVLALPAEGHVAKDEVIDLSGKMDASGKLEWTAPAGKWLIYRFGHTTMGALTQPNQWEILGLECDKMSEKAVEFHLRHVLGALKKHLGPLVGTGLKHILLDSYEAGTPSWTPLMPEEFAQRRGYDLKAFLPAFAGRVMGSDQETGEVPKGILNAPSPISIGTNFSSRWHACLPRKACASPANRMADRSIPEKSRLSSIG